MKLITDEKLAKLIEDAFTEGMRHGQSVLAGSFITTERKVKELVEESLQKASEQ